MTHDKRAQRADSKDAARGHHEVPPGCTRMSTRFNGRPRWPGRGPIVDVSIAIPQEERSTARRLVVSSGCRPWSTEKVEGGAWDASALSSGCIASSHLANAQRFAVAEGVVRRRCVTARLVAITHPRSFNLVLADHPPADALHGDRRVGFYCPTTVHVGYTTPIPVDVGAAPRAPIFHS